jgi:hypothetical protein
VESECSWLDLNSPRCHSTNDISGRTSILVYNPVYPPRTGKLYTYRTLHIPMSTHLDNQGWIMSRWQKTAVPPRADSTRIFYLDPKTGEMCYRLAEWKPGGKFGPSDAAPGIGVTYDLMTGAQSRTGKV